MKRIFTLMITAFLLMMTNLVWGQTRATVTDELNYDVVGVTGSNYTSWSDVTSNSDAVYAGQSAGGNESIQLRSKNSNSGIITTASGGTVTSVSVVWNTNTASGRTLNIYGSNVAYTDPSDLYDSTTQGTLLGTIVNGTSTSLAINGSYTHIGIRSNNSALYLDKIEIIWTTGGGQQNVAMPTFSPASGTYYEAQNVTISCSTDGATIHYTLDGSTPTENSTTYSTPIAISETTTVKAIGVKDGMSNSNVATATYTIQELTEINTVSGLWDYAETVGTTETPASVTFNDWYVTAVKSSQAWVSDGQYGFVIYQYGHGFNAGDKLNGTFTCTVLMYQNHYAELKGVMAENLTVTSGQETPVLSTTIGALQVRNYGTAIDLGTLTYDGSVFVDDNQNTIALYNQLNLNPNPITSLESGKQYNVKGISTIYWPNNGDPIQQIAPRSADDFEEVVSPTLYTVSVAESIVNGTVTVEPNSAEEGTTITVTAIPDDNYELTALTYTYAGVESPYDILDTMQFIMPASDVTVDATFSPIVLDTVDTPTFSPEAGTFTQEIEVTMACETDEASIYYTTDGTDPLYEMTGINGTLYSEPIAISETTTVKAMAVKDGMSNSEIAVAVYTIIPPTPVVETNYTLITNENALIAGDKYIIVGLNGETYKAISKQANNNRPAIEVTPEGNIISVIPASETGADAVYEFTLGQEGDNWTFYDTVYDGYLYAASSSSNWLRTQAENNANGQWTIEIAANGVATITAQGTNTRNWLRYNNNSSIFSCYGSTSNQSDVYLYKAGTIPTPPAPTYYTVSIDEGIINGTVTAEPTSAIAGDTIMVTALANVGYELSALTYTYAGVATPIDIMDSQQFIMPAADVTVSATFGSLDCVATPTFTPGEGSYITAQEVTIACATEGASIYYTLDGTEPTTESTLYSEPFIVEETTTVKAFAVKEYMIDSDATSATYTIIEPMTIAEARALADNEYALVQGVVTFLEGRNVFIQDETGGVNLYLNSNTVPSTIALGDMVKGYGKKTVYGGLVELTAINGNDENQFLILSSGNPLPVMVKTIAEIVEDFNGDNVLQATRVQVENAVIGSINTGGNTTITQGENSIIIYKIPAVEGLMEGDIVTITGIIGAFNNVLQLRVALASDVQYTHPAGITVNPASLSGFSYVYEEGPSTVKTFVISGSNLSAPTHIYAPENYEMSSFPGDVFTPETHITINTYSGAYNYTIKVRLKAGLEVGSYDEDIVVYQEEVDSLYVALSGNVTNEPPQPSGYTRISELSQLASGSKVIFAARYNDNASEYYAMTAQTTGKPEGVSFTSVIETAETLPAEITDEEDTYYWTVDVNGDSYTFTNANGDVLGYASSTNFSTGGDNTAWGITYQTSEATAMVPEYSGFVVNNVNNAVRAIALNSNYNFGPYHTQNIAAENYNFFLDIFATDGGGTLTCATPTFTPEAGTYYEAQEVSIACTTADAIIYYTLDGSDPTENSSVYEEPIAVTESVTIKAIAMKEGYENSNIATADYTISLGAVTIFEQDWEGEMNGWTFVTVEGSKPWTIGQYQGNHYANANGYNGGANEQWCISPAFDLDSYSDVTLSFVNAKNYNGPDMQLYFSNDYDGTDPTAATWTELSFEMSTGSFAWAESGAIEFTGLTGDSCYIGFKYISTETEAAAWEVDNIVLVGFTSDPVLSVSTTALAGFTYVEGNGPSNEQTFNINGNNLTENVTLTMSDDSFEMSLSSGDDFAALSTITLTPDNGAVNQTIYVRMAAELTISAYSGTITVESELEDITVSLNGSVVEGGGSWNRILSLSDLHDGDQVIIASRYDVTIGNGYYAMPAVVTGKPDGVLFTSENNGGVETLPEEIANDVETYLWNVTLNDTIITLINAAGDSLGYSSSTNFSGGVNTDWSITFGTAGDGAMIPNYSGFVITNGTTTNRGIAKNASNKFGAYSTSNINNADYNFYLDLFINGGSVTPTVATPVFSMASGTYYEAIDVEITCATEGATIYYTTDGSEPTAASTVYSSAIAVDSDMTIKAIAMKDGYDNSSIASASYVIMTDVVIIFNQDWEGEMNGWTFVTVEGNKPWTIGEHNGDHYANANGYNDDVDNEQWCISPAFDLTQYAGSNVALTFLNAKNYNGPDLELYFSNDYDGQDPTAAEWQPMAFEMSTGGYDWTVSGNISLNSFSGENCYIGFRYLSTIEDGAAAWEVDDIMLYANIGEDPYITATPNALSGFTHIINAGPSEAQTFIISGGNLPPAPGGNEGAVIVSCDNSHYEFSLDGDEYDLILNIPVVGTLEPTTIYVRLNGEEVGTYEGIVTIEDYVTTTVTLSGEVTNDDGIDETLASSVSVWNSNNELMIENDRNETLNVTVFNLIGQPVLSETVATGSNVIRHDLIDGVYIVRIANGKEMTGVKVVVRR